MVEFSTFYYNMKCTSVYHDDENEWWNCYIVMIIKLKKEVISLLTCWSHLNLIDKGYHSILKILLL